MGRVGASRKREKGRSNGRPRREGRWNRVKIKVSGPAHTEEDIKTSFALINGDGTLDSADLTSPANRTCSQAQGPFRSTRRIAAMAWHRNKNSKKKLRPARGLPGAASARSSSSPASAGTCRHIAVSAYIRVHMIEAVLCEVAIHGRRIGNPRYVPVRPASPAD